jgi:hypothetical protein
MRFAAALTFVVLLAPGAARGAELLAYRLVARHGRVEPAPIAAPAGRRFKIEIENAGRGPIEFESRDLKQEKVLAPGAKSFVVVNPLKPGEYRFFDDFHQDTGQGRIVVR